MTDRGSKISIVNVEKTYSAREGDVHALGPVSLDIVSGEFLCIVGPSGCGKSTLLRMIAELSRPSKGELRLTVGKDRGIPTAMVFQNYGIYPWKTVEDNVRFGLELEGVPKKEQQDRARHWLQMLRLDEFRNQYPDALSGGMRQRVAIARALAVEPEILLMDEPFAALDAQLREVLQDELLSICQSANRTVVFVTHSLEEALILGDRIMVMSGRPGRVLKIVDVPFERPRVGALRSTPAFNELRRDIWEMLRPEIAGTSAPGVLGATLQRAAK